MTTRNLIELISSLCLEVWLIVLLFRRGARHHFPVFVTYILLSAPVTAARLLTASHYQVYFYVYWTTNALLSALGLAALHEVFRWVYEGFYELRGFRLLYYGAIAAVLLVAIRNAIVNPPVQAHPLVGLILDMGIAINLLQAGIACLFFALMRPLAIEFRRYPYGVALGFLISGIGSVLGYWAVSVFGTKWYGFARYASPVAYILGLLIWFSAFVFQEIEEEWTPPISPERMLHELEGYLRALGFRGRNDER